MQNQKNMKNLLRKAMLIVLITMSTFMLKSASAQVNISFNVNTQPLWGPANVDYVEYYYLPEVDVYYNVPTSQYVYLSRGKWITVNTLPASYRVDLYRTYKVVINEKRPYMNHSMYKTKYVKYKHSYNKQSPNRDHPNRGNANQKGKNSNGNSSPQKKGGKGNKGK